jgi:membrane protein YdbS with pleckstrin-like domain
MLYEALKEPLLSLLRAPAQPPDPPLGTPGSVEIFRASPRYLTLQLLRHFGSLGTALAFELVAWTLMPAPAEVPMWRGGAVFAVAAGMVVTLTLAAMLSRYFLIRLDYDMRYYILTDRSLRIRRGALTIEESTYTFANVQNLTLQQGPLERWLGITHLQLDTAGGGVQKGGGEGTENLHHHGRLEGIDLQTAAELRDRILRLVRSYRDAGLGDEPAVLAASAPTERRAAVLRTIIEELRQIRPSGAPPERDPN